MIVREFDFEWSAFVGKHNDWFRDRAAVDQPLYCLPEELLDRLARNQPSILHPHERDVEMDLGELCLAHHTVGVWRDRPIGFGPLDPPMAPVPASLLQGMTELGWTRAQIAATRTLTQATEPLHVRLKGWAGLLMSEPNYLTARDELYQIWNELPADDRWRVRLIRTPGYVGPVPTASEFQRVDPHVANFTEQFDAFCDRWGLAGMATWDLPCPDGPKLAVLGDLHARQLPPSQAVLAVPVGGHVSAETLQRSLHLAKQYQAEQNQWGFEPSATTHFAAYGQLLEVGHYEQVVTGRYANRTGRNYRFISRLEEAIARALQVSTQHIRRLRRQLKACRRGKRPRRLS